MAEVAEERLKQSKILASEVLKVVEAAVARRLKH